MRGWWLLGLWACGGNEDPTETFPAPLPTGTTCTTDEECPTDSYCGDESDCVALDTDGSAASATPISISEAPDSHGVIAPAGDIDWWVFTAVEAQWIDVRTIVDGDLDTVVRVWRADGTEHAAMDDFATGGADGYDSILRVFLPEPGDWFITVEDLTTWDSGNFGEADWRGGSSYTYDLWVQEFGSDLDEVDAIDDPSEVFTLEDGSTIYSYGFLIQDAGDSDFALAELNVAGEPLEVWGQPYDYGSSLELRTRLYDGSGALLSDLSGMGLNRYLSYFNPAVGGYTIEVTDSNGAGGDDAWGVLYVRTYNPGSFHPFFADNSYTLEVEPNETPGEATQLSLEEEGDTDFSYEAGRFEGALSVDPDTDHFGLVAGAGEFLSLRCFTDGFGSLAQISVRAWDPLGVDATPTGDGDAPEGEDYWLANVPISEGGTWSVSVSSSDAVYGLHSYYRCAAFLSAERISVE